VTRRTNGQRKRGVRASRARLAHALSKAGLKTQAQLADRMADREGLDSAPRDLVSRAFRELPVEAQSLERIARALGIEAAGLYKSRSASPEPEALPRAKRTIRPALLMTAFATLAVFVAVFFWQDQPSKSEDETGANRNAGFPVLNTGRRAVMVLSFAGDSKERLAPALRERLDETFAVASGPATALMAAENPLEAAARLRTERIVEGEVVTRGRFAGVRLHLIADGTRRQVWAESLPAARLEDETGQVIAGIIERIARALEAKLSGTGVDSLPHFPLAPVQDDYLEGRYFLDRPASELNLKRAQSRFSAALRRDGNYALAHAGLCEALLEEHWMSDEQRALDEAALACGRALQLDPKDPMVRAAHAHFLRLTGRLEDSIAVYEDVLGTHPYNAHVLAGFAFTLLQQFRKTGDNHLLENALQAAGRSAEVDPAYWKPPFFQANMHYFAGDVVAALAAAERALARDENEMVLANVGTLRFCHGDVEGARAAYQRAAELAPHSYVGDEFMGMVHYYLGEFDEAVRLRARAIESIAAGRPEMHQMWGNLADAQRHAGDSEAAAASYLGAIEIVERDLLRGTAADADRAARAWYYTALAELRPDAVVKEALDGIASDLGMLDVDTLDPTAFLRLAQTWARMRQLDNAMNALDRATSICRVYRNAPDLISLTTGDSISRGNRPVEIRQDRDAG